MDVCNPSIWESEAGGLMWVWGQLGLHHEYYARRGYRIRLCLKKKKKKKKKKRQDKTRQDRVWWQIFFVNWTGCVYKGASRKAFKQGGNPSWTWAAPFLWLRIWTEWKGEDRLSTQTYPSLLPGWGRYAQLSHTPAPQLQSSCVHEYFPLREILYPKPWSKIRTFLKLFLPSILSQWWKNN